MPGPPPPECGAPTRRQASPTQPTAGPRPRELARRPLGAPLIKSLGRPRSRPRSALAPASEPAPGSDSEDDNRHPVHRKSYYDADTEERAHTARPGGALNATLHVLELLVANVEGWCPRSSFGTGTTSNTEWESQRFCVAQTS